MPNQVPVTLQTTLETLRSLSNECMALSSIGTQNERYFQEGQPIGSTLQIVRPWKPVGREGQGFRPEGIVQTTVPLTISYWRGVDWIYNDRDEALYLDMERYHRKYSRPAGIALANLIDADFLAYMQLTAPNFVGTAGTTPTTKLVYNQAQTSLNKLLAPQTNRSVIYTSEYNQNLVDQGSALFNPQREISDQYLNGYVGKYAGFRFGIDEQIPAFTNGTWVASGQVSSNGQMGSTLTFNNFTSSSVSVVPGMRFTIDGVYKTNPQGARTPYTGSANLLQFVIQQPATDTTGTVSFQVYPPLIPAGPFRNASNTPLSGNAINFVGTTGSSYNTGFYMQKEAYTAAFINLMKPPNTECTVVDGADLDMPGIPPVRIRSIKQWQSAGPFDGFMTQRMDCIYGITAQYADNMAGVILG